MKKNLAILGLALGAACLFVIMACESEKVVEAVERDRNTPHDRSGVDAQQMMPHQSANGGMNTPRTAPAPDVVPHTQAPAASNDLSCTPGAANQCVVIPDGCLGCMKKGGKNRVVSIKAAQQILQNTQQQCASEAQSFMAQHKAELEQLKASVQSGKRPSKPSFASDDQSCTYNKGVCNAQGQCEFGIMSREEEQQAMQRMQKSMNGNPQGGGGQGGSANQP